MTQTVGKKKSIDFFIDCTADDKQNIVQAGQDQIWQQSSHVSHVTISDFELVEKFQKNTTNLPYFWNKPHCNKSKVCI